MLGEDGIPSPYGEGFSRPEDPLERTRSQWYTADLLRRRAGDVARHPLSIAGRNLLAIPLIAFAAVILALPNAPISSPLALLAIWGPFSILLVLVATLAAEATNQVLAARIQLRAWGDGGEAHDLKAQPGLDLVQERINELRRINLLQGGLIGGITVLLLTSSALDSTSISWNLALLLVMLAGIAQIWHAHLTSNQIREFGDPHPLLTSFVPTHHSTQFDGTLSDLVITHLDPDLAIEWREWCARLARAALDPSGPRKVRERTLVILHLHEQGHLDDDTARARLDDLLGADAVEELLLDSSNLLNWRSVQRLMQHALAWQPNAAMLMDRLIGAAVSGTARRPGRAWRMDVALGPVCERGTGHLFVMVHHWDEGRAPAHIEILAPGGEPSRREHRVVLEGCRPIESPLDLSGPDGRASLDRVVDHVDRAAMLWFRLAWPMTQRGSTRVLVHLKDAKGRLIEAQVLRTDLRPTARGTVRGRVRRLVEARTVGELPMPGASKALPQAVPASGPLPTPTTQAADPSSEEDA